MPERSNSPSQASRLLSATDKLTDGQQRLEASHRVALETEQVGSGILNDLRSQRERLTHTRDNVSRLYTSTFSCGTDGVIPDIQLYQADGSIDRASQSLQKMVRR